jgi:predicted Zn-ribbon and HTH transcriptional regulator
MPYPSHCPSCKADLDGGPMPSGDRESPDAARFNRAIGIVIQDQDRVSSWRCPDCGHEWPR